MPEHNDEISLRDLYLILRRGLPLIVGVAFVVGVAAFALSSLLPSNYRSTAVVQVTPSPVGEQQVGGLDFDPRANLSFEAYRSIAFSAPVLEEALASAGSSGLSLGEARQRFELQQLSRPSNSTQIAPLTMEHGVRGDDAEEVVRLADAWSRASLGAVRAAVSSSLVAMAETTSQALERRQAAVDDSEAAWQAFRAGDTRDASTIRLNDINNRLARNGARIDELEQLIAIASARQAFLRGQLELTGPVAPVDIGTQLEALIDAELLSPESVNQLRALMAARPAVTPQLDQDLLVLLVRAELQQQTSRLVEHIAEHDVIRNKLEVLEQQAETLRAHIAELDRIATTLERALNDNRQAYGSVADIVPLIDYAAELAATSASLLSGPTAPPSVVGRGAAFNAVVAALLAGILLVLYTFLREAVREPPDQAATPTGSGGHDPDAPQGA